MSSGPREDQDLAKCIDLFSSVSEKCAESLSLTAQMLDNACAASRSLSSMRHELRKLQDAAAMLQFKIGSSSRVHVFLEAPLDMEDRESSSGGCRVDLATISLFSPTIVYATGSSATGSSLMSNLVSETFSTAAVISGAYFSTDFSTQDKSSIVTVPDWFPFDKREMSGKSRSAHDLKSPYSLYKEMATISPSDFQTLYRDFFVELHSAANAPGALEYSKWAPPWLFHSTALLYGKRHENVVQVTDKTLPHRRLTRTKSGSTVCRVILTLWLVHEPGTRALLISILRKYSRFLGPFPAEISIDAKRRDGIFEPPEDNKSHVDGAEHRLISSGMPNSDYKDGMLEKKNSSADSKDSNDDKDMIDPPASPKSRVPVSVVNGISLIQDDVDALLGIGVAGELNDNVVNAFCSMLHCKTVVVLNTFLYKILLTDPCGGIRVARWLKRKEMDQCKVVIIPLHSDRCHHWGLAALYKETKTISVYDSLPGANAFTRNDIGKLEYWVSSIYELISLPDWPDGWRLDMHPKVRYSPLQDNSYDCGVFLCMNAYFVSIGEVNPGYSAKDIPLFRRQMYDSLLNVQIQIDPPTH